MQELDRSKFPRIGSLLMLSCASRDEHGWPYQVPTKMRPGGSGTEGPVRDDHGRVLVLVMGDGGRPLKGDSGALLVQVAPADVSDAAERWWTDQQETE